MQVTLLDNFNNTHYINLMQVERFYMIGDSVVVIVFLDGGEMFYSNYHVVRASMK